MKNNKYEETHRMCEEVIKGCSAECRIAQFPHEKAESCSRCGGWPCPYKETQVTCIPCTSDGYIHSPRLKGLIKVGMRVSVYIPASNETIDAIIKNTTEGYFVIFFDKESNCCCHPKYPGFTRTCSFTGGMPNDYWIKILPEDENRVLTKSAMDEEVSKYHKADKPTRFHRICDAPREMFQVGRRVRTNGTEGVKSVTHDSREGYIGEIQENSFFIWGKDFKGNVGNKKPPNGLNSWEVDFNNNKAWIEFLPKEDKMGIFSKGNKAEAKEVWKSTESQEHFEMSQSKWEKVRDDLGSLKRLVVGECGHCEEATRVNESGGCRGCALVKTVCGKAGVYNEICDILNILPLKVIDMLNGVLNSKPAFMKKEEVFYKVGDKFDSGFCINILCHISDGVLLMVDTASSQFNSKQISYGGDVNHISESKFQKMFGSGYTLIKD